MKALFFWVIFWGILTSSIGFRPKSFMHLPVPLKMTSSPVTPNILVYEVPEQVKALNCFLVNVTKNLLVSYYGNNTIARFYALETIARVPYFSYASVLHLYETTGAFREKAFIKLHFEESWNELHHLLIMEALGGNKKFQDRFLAQHIAFFYYWVVVVLYVVSPATAYHLNQCVEEHAYETYTDFIEKNELVLKSAPAPEVAIQYYQNDVLFNHPDEANIYSNVVSGGDEKVIPIVERPKKIETLHDTFVNIRADEAVHARTMKQLQRQLTLLKRGGGTSG